MVGSVHEQGKDQIGLVRTDAGFCANAILTHFEDHSLSYVVAGRLLPELSLLPPGLGRNRGGLSSARLASGAGQIIAGGAGLSISTRCDQSDAAAGRGRRLCRQSADSENRIAELKQDFGLTNFCLDAFWDTEAAFQTVLMAYNVMSLFRQALLRAPQAVKLSTIPLH